MSTGRFQDPTSSQEWQHDNAVRLIDGRGRIVVEFFDIGYSRALPWQHRPQAAAGPDPGFDAVVIGEFERAFIAGQARNIIAELNAYGINVWLTELDGPPQRLNEDQNCRDRGRAWRAARDPQSRGPARQGGDLQPHRIAHEIRPRPRNDQGRSRVQRLRPCAVCVSEGGAPEIRVGAHFECA
jgi:hypothetical protein